MPSVFQIKKYLQHWLLRVDQHSVHSPYFFDFYEKVIQNKYATPGLPEIEGVRGKLLQSAMEIDVIDIGAPSKHFKGQKRSLAKVAATSAQNKAHAELLYRIVHHINATSIVELGTSVGLTTLYLANPTGSHVTTFEGNTDLIQIAKTHFEFFNADKITLVEGNIDTTLPRFLQSPGKIQFALLDANHRYEPTLRYFLQLCRRMDDKGIIVIDDIYSSAEMEQAWNELKHHDLIYGSIDLFYMGILFFDPALNRQHYIWAV